MNRRKLFKTLLVAILGFPFFGRKPNAISIQSEEVKVVPLEEGNRQVLCGIYYTEDGEIPVYRTLRPGELPMIIPIIYKRHA